MKFYLHQTRTIMVNKRANNFCKKFLLTLFASSLALVDKKKKFNEIRIHLCVLF
jgi:hypothetical protein